MWSQKIKKLVADGMTQVEIADKVCASQGYISKMYNGLKEDPRSSVAAKIDELYAERFAPKKKRVRRKGRAS